MSQLKIPDLKIPGVSQQKTVPTIAPEIVTGVPVFLGLTEKISKPKRLTLWTQFEQYFGKPTGYLAHAVRGFFENGGRLCYVVALKDETRLELQQGLEIIENLDTIDLVCAPDIMRSSEVQAMQNLILAHCDKMGDRFAILDALNVSRIQDIDEQRQGLKGDNGALYTPWLTVENVKDSIPPCGHIAGIYARNDREVGVHRAPANYLLEGLLDLILTLTDADQELLNPEAGAGVNCIRSFRGRGIRVWGARTLSQNPQWQYISVRRLFLTVGRWCDRHLADAVFEPNDFSLWIRLERELSVYCEALWKQGALQGATAQEAFWVKCNAQTNPPEMREQGQVVTEIGLAPTVPGEFIRVSLIHGSSGVTLTEF